MTDHDTSMNGTGTIARLQELLARHEAAAAVLRRSLELLTDEASAVALRRSLALVTDAETPPALAEALLPIAKAPRRRKKRRSRPAARPSTALILETFHRTRPRTGHEVARQIGAKHAGQLTLGILTRYGYLQRKGDGYVRTAKPYPSV